MGSNQLTKSKRLVLIATIIISSVVIASVAIFIGICVWDWYYGLVLLYTLIPAVIAFSCIFGIVAVVLASRASTQERLAQEPIVQLTADQQQRQQFCPNCGTAYTPGLKICPNCSYEL